MLIVYQQKQFLDKKQALIEFAFCKFPLTINVDGDDMTFEEFSALERYVKSLED